MHFRSFIENFNLSQDVQTLENETYGVRNLHIYFFALFERLFPFSEDREDMQKLLRTHRQLLIDFIPKLMLMYSGDRYFVGEMLWIAGDIYNSCMYGGSSSILCPLQIERLVSYYFSGVLYGTQLKLERAFYDYMLGRRKLVDGGMSLQDLLHPNAVEVMDRFIADIVFNPKVIEDYIFFERGWSSLNVHLNGNTSSKRTTVYFVSCDSCSDEKFSTAEPPLGSIDTAINLKKEKTLRLLFDTLCSECMVNL